MLQNGEMIRDAILSGREYSKGLLSPQA